MPEQAALPLPQWATSEDAFDSQPLEGSKSCSANPSLQFAEQVLELHEATVLSGAGQATLQPPQLFTSLAMLVSHPAAVVQSAYEDEQAMPHARGPCAVAGAQ